MDYKIIIDLRNQMIDLNFNTNKMFKNSKLESE